MTIAVSSSSSSSSSSSNDIHLLFNLFKTKMIDKAETCSNLTCFVMCGCFGNMYICIYCFVLFVLCFLNRFVYVYSFLFVLSVLM